MNRTVALIATVAALSVSSVCASTKSTNPEVINELCAVMNLEKSAEQGAEIMLKTMEQQMPQMMQQIMGPAVPNDPKASEARRKDFAEFNQRFGKRYRELLKEKVQIGKTIRDIYAPLFDRYFSEEEMRALITFYKSPLGSKLLTTMPEMMQEAMQKSAQTLNPKIIEVVQIILEEEKARFAAQKKAAPAAPQTK